MKNKPTMKTKIYRQGDVLIRQISAIPQSAEAQKTKGKLVLALGEVTGHHHHIVTKKSKLYKDSATQATYLEVAEALALLQHEEHDTINLPAGNYEVTIQREYFPEEIRNVQD